MMNVGDLHWDEKPGRKCARTSTRRDPDWRIAERLDNAIHLAKKPAKDAATTQRRWRQVEKLSAALEDSTRV